MRTVEKPGSADNIDDTYVFLGDLPSTNRTHARADSGGGGSGDGAVVVSDEVESKQPADDDDDGGAVADVDEADTAEGGGGTPLNLVLKIVGSMIK